MDQYVPFETIAAGIVSRLKATGKFSSVIYAQVTNGNQLWDILEALSALPCAVVAIGNVDYEKDGLMRTIRPLIFVVNNFQRGIARETSGSWQLLETAKGQFLPVATARGIELPEIEGIGFAVASSTPIQSPAHICACSITLEGKEFMKGYQP